MNGLAAVILSQAMVLAYHQLTTLVDLYPFNGARNYSTLERSAEAGLNGVLMALPLLGFGLQLRSLMWFGVIYYPVLFLMELVIWWIPYFVEPRGTWRRVYNLVLRVATTNFAPGDPLEHWKTTYSRIYPGTLSFLLPCVGRIVPNLEHTILHALTAITAALTISCFYLHGFRSSPS